MSTEFYWISSLILNAIVGVILFKQIESQKQIIGIYKDYVSAVDPSKIVALQKEEVERIKKLASDDLNELKTQVQQLANVAANNIELMERHDTMTKKTEHNLGFNKLTWINTYIPNCGKIIDITMKSRKDSLG